MKCWRCGSTNIILLYEFYRDYHFRMNPGFNAMFGCKDCRSTDSERAGFMGTIEEYVEFNKRKEERAI